MWSIVRRYVVGRPVFSPSIATCTIVRLSKMTPVLILARLRYRDSSFVDTVPILVCMYRSSLLYRPYFFILFTPLHQLPSLSPHL